MDAGDPVGCSPICSQHTPFLCMLMASYCKHLQLSTWELPLALAHRVDQQSGELTPPGVALK